jgi:hypothetical protein
MEKEYLEVLGAIEMGTARRDPQKGRQLIRQIPLANNAITDIGKKYAAKLQFRRIKGDRERGNAHRDKMEILLRNLVDMKNNFRRTCE